MRKFFILFASSIITIHAQVGINTTTPNAALEINSNNSGILIPRVTLLSTLDTTTVTNPTGNPLTEGTLIYNNTNAGSGTTAVVPGFYYWNGTTWTSIVGSKGWELTGNTGTSTSNFIGTTDATPIHLATNGNTWLTITHDTDQYYNGSVIVNPSAMPISSYRFTVAEDVLDRFALGSTITNDTSQGVCIETYHANYNGGAGIMSNAYYGIISSGSYYAGLFSGDVNITNDLTVNGTLFTPSDKRIKSNIRTINNALEKILLLKPSLYHKNLNLINQNLKNVKLNQESLNHINTESKSITEFGLIAQELELVFPELVHESKNTLKDNSSPLKSVNYIGLIPILIKAIQEQQTEMESLKNENKELKEKVEYILNTINK